MFGINLFGLIILFSLIGYLIGNILFGLLLSKLKHVDLRKMGSGNVGATNTLRIMGKTSGIFVLLFDFSKSIISCIICLLIYKNIFWNISDSNYEYSKFGILIYISGFFAIVGHCYPIMYIYSLFKTKFNFEESKKFSGGKGVSTAAGYIAIISPWLFFICFIIFFSIVFTTRYVSLSSISTSIAIMIFPLVPQLDYLYILNLFDSNIINVPSINRAFEINNILNYDNYWWYIFGIWLMLSLSGSLVIYRHKANIKRLLKKQESKIF